MKVVAEDIRLSSPESISDIKPRIRNEFCKEDVFK